MENFIRDLIQIVNRQNEPNQHNGPIFITVGLSEFSAFCAREAEALKNVTNQTEEMCLNAVKKNGMALQYVKTQNHQICEAAVSENANALQYVKTQTNDLCLLAVKQNGLTLRYVSNQSNEICNEAINQNRFALKFVKSQKDAKQVQITECIAFKNQFSTCEDTGDCSICLDSNNKSSFILIDKCKHHFHKECLNTWFKNQNQLTCPLCRSRILSNIV